MTDTHYKSIVPIGEDARRATGSVQWLLEKDEDKNSPIYHQNNLELFICGEDAFKQIAADLKKARHSVEIICWGFDPAMELTRTKTTWPRGETWGGLLKEVAEGKHNGGKPVQVRVLSWYGFIGNLGTNNMPGFGKAAGYDVRQAVSRGMAGAVSPGGAGALPPAPEPTDPKDRREVFNARWYQEVSSGKLSQLQIRTRNGDSKAVAHSLEEEPGRRDWSETVGMEQVATDHQKTILIDYEHEGGASAVGYVMGLNSVTDYWDTQQHLFNDPRRGASWEGAGGDEPGLKPYQDYACRIRGAALVAVSKNFTDAWNRAKGKGDKLTRSHDVRKPPAGLTQKLSGKAQRAQIVRTQPEEGDKSIKRLYAQATSFARHYLYIENQYFQYSEWATQLRQLRTAFAKGWQAASKSPADLPNLHVMAVIPTPERAQMVPRTYDTAKALGQGTSMPNQDKKVEEELKRHKAQQARWDEHLKHQSAKGEVPDPALAPAPLSPAAKSAQEVGEKATIAKGLEAAGLRTLVGSLWSFDHDWRQSQAKAMQQAGEWEGVAGQSQRSKALQDKLAAGRYREIYIHSKLMLIDDSFFTLGSANLNPRSMAVDAEINVASDDPGTSRELRRRVWGLHTGAADDCNPPSIEPKPLSDAFDAWQKLMKANADKKIAGTKPTGFLMPFHDDRTSSIRLG